MTSFPLADCAAAIIAGGSSRRMGRPKALIDFQGRPLIAHTAALLAELFPRVIVVTAAPEIAVAAASEAVADIYPGKGPLGGIHAALFATGIATFCVACDMPYLNAKFIVWLSTQRGAVDVVVPEVGGYLEPLHAYYEPGCLPRLEQELAHERIRPLQQILRDLPGRIVNEEEAGHFDAQLTMFRNWNLPGDVE